MAVQPGQCRRSYRSTTSSSFCLGRPCLRLRRLHPGPLLKPNIRGCSGCPLHPRMVVFPEAAFSETTVFLAIAFPKFPRGSISRSNCLPRDSLSDMHPRCGTRSNRVGWAPPALRTRAVHPRSAQTMSEAGLLAGLSPRGGALRIASHGKGY